MIIYNVTSNVQNDVHDEWMEWIKPHIALVLSTGSFLEARFAKVLVDNEDDTHTYSIQYMAKSREALEHYYKNNAESLRRQGAEKWADKVLAFRTELDVIDDFTVSLTD